MPGILLAPRSRVLDASTHSLYHEPTVMWRMQREDQSSHAVITPHPDGTFLFMWFINGRPLGYRHCHDWTGAIRWSEQMLSQNWAVGWRLEPEYDDIGDDE
jgi:hypothetical protein